MADEAVSYDELRKYQEIVENKYIKALERGPDGKVVRFTGKVARSFWEDAQKLMMLGHRIAFTAGATASDLLEHDPARSYGQSLPQEFMSKLAEHWKSEDAKEFAIHNTWLGENAMRGLYTYLQFRQGTAEDPERLFNSPAATEFAKDYGPLIVDVPAMMLTEPWVGSFGVGAKAVGMAQKGYIAGALKNLKPGADFNATLAWMESHFEGGVLTDRLIEAVRLAPRGGDAEKALTDVLHGIGMRRPGFLGQAEEAVRQHLPTVAEKLGLPYFRPVGYTFSPAQNVMRQDLQLMKAKASESFKAAWDASPTLKTFAEEATAQELMQYLAAMSDTSNLRRFTERVLSGRQNASPRVIAAVRESLNIRSVNAAFMNKFWKEDWYKLLREQEFLKEVKLWRDGMTKGGKAIPQSLQTLSAKDLVFRNTPKGMDVFDARNGRVLPIPAQTRRKMAKYMADLPSIMEWPYRRIFLEGMQEQGSFRAPAVRLAKEINRGKSNASRAAYLRNIQDKYSKDPEAVRAATRKMFDELVSFQKKALSDGAHVRYDKHLDYYIEKLKSIDPAEFGGARGKEELLRRAEDTKAFVHQVYNFYGETAVPEALRALRNSLWVWDSVNKEWKATVLFSPGMFMQYVGQNTPDNILKAVMFDGPGQFIEDLPTHRLDGTKIDALVSHAPRLGTEAGFQFIKDLKGMENPGSKAWRWWSDTVDRLNEVPETLGKGMGWRYNYKVKLQEIERSPVTQTLDMRSKDRIAAEFADSRQDMIQFYLRPASVALSWVERVNPFAIFQVRQLQAAVELAKEQPALSHGMYELYDRLSESKLLPNGELEVPGLGVTVRAANIVPFLRIEDTMKKAPGLDTNSPEDLAASSLGAAATMAAGLSGGGYHFTQSAVLPPLRIAAVPFVALSRAGSGDQVEGSERAYTAAKESFSKRSDFVSSVLTPISRFTQTITGKGINDFLDPYYTEREALIKYKAAFLDGNDSISLEQAGQDAKDRARYTAGLKVLLPVATQAAQSPGEQLVRTSMRLYDTLDTPDARRSFLERLPKDRDGRSILDGIVRSPDRVPMNHPDAQYLSTIEEALSDPQKALEKYSEGTAKQKTSAIKHFFEFLSDAIASPAGAAELPPSERVAVQKRRDTAGDLPDRLKSYAESIHVPEAQFVKTVKAEAPHAPSSEGFAFESRNFRPQLTQSGRGSVFDFFGGVDRGELQKRNPVLLHEMEKRNGEYNTALRLWLRGFKDISNNPNVQASDYERWAKGEIPFKGDTWAKLNVKYFMTKGEDGLPNVVSILEAAKQQGVALLDSNGKPIAGSTQLLDDQDFPRAMDAVAYLRLKQIPQDARISIDKREKASSELDYARLKPWLEKLRVASRDIQSYDLGSVLSSLKSEMAKNDPAGPPPDFFEKAMKRGEWQTLSDFAVAYEADQAQPYAHLLYERDRYGRAVPSFNGLGMMVHLGLGQEAVGWALATNDKTMLTHLQDLGMSVDAESFRQNSLEKVLELQAGIDLTPAMRISSGRFLPAQEGDPGGMTRAVLSPTTGDAPDPLTLASRVVPMISRVPFTVKDVEYFKESAYLGALPNSYRSTTEYVQSSAQDAQRINASLETGYAVRLYQQWKDKGMTMEEAQSIAHDEAPKVNIFYTAARNLAGLPVGQMARGARDVMGFAYQFGLVDRSAIRALDRGIAQTYGIDLAHTVISNALTLGNFATASLSLHDRVQLLRTSADRLSQQTGNSFAAERAASLTRQANFITYANAAGNALSFGAGVAQQFGERNLATGLGTAGGVAQGAAIGSSILPGVGTVIGAAIGGALGYFGSSLGFPDNEDPNAELRRQALGAQKAYYDVARQNALIQGQLQESRSFQNTTRTLAYTTSTNLRRSPATAAQALSRFVRRPQFGSSQGLSSVAERSAARQFTPRY